jgi:gluconate 2-dehydrogenase gamma chain
MKGFGKKVLTGHFFELIRSHTMAGYYRSPRHGGNYIYVSYRMIGLDIPTIQGRNKHNLS